MKHFLSYLFLLGLLSLAGCGSGGDEDQLTVSVKTSAPDGSYGPGSEIEVELIFSEEITKEGVVTVHLDSGGIITFSNFSGTTAKGIYTIQEGENSLNLSVSSIVFSGELEDMVEDGELKNIPENIEVESKIIIDSTPPEVGTALSSSESGLYGLGGQIEIQLNFSEEVLLNGTLEANLSSGAKITFTEITDKTANGTYQVKNGDNTSQLNITSFAVNGSLKDIAGNSFLLSAPQININPEKEIVVDTSSPMVSSITSSSESGVYGEADELEITIHFSEHVNMAGTISVHLDSGGILSYENASGTSATSVYTVKIGENSADLSVTSITGKGTFKDDANNEFLFDVPQQNLDENKDIIIDTADSQITSIESSTVNGSYKVGSAINVTLNFGETITLTGTMLIKFNSGGTAQISSFSGTSIIGVYTIKEGENTDDLSVTEIIVTGTALDNAGNSLETAIPVSNIDTTSDIVIDTTAPKIIAVTSTSIDGTYRKDSEISIQLEFSEVITVTGTLSVLLDSSGTVKFGTFSGTSASATYTVLVGENSADLAASSFTINGTGVDATGNEFSGELPQDNLNTSSDIIVDTTSLYAKASDKEASRFLTQVTFGPSLATIDAMEGRSYEAWIKEQIELPATYMYPQIKNLLDDDIPYANHVGMWWNLAVDADDQLRQRVAFALSEILVISDQSGLSQRKKGLANYYDILIRNSFGNFRTLLEDVTKSPVMGLYLSMLGNRKPDPSKNIRPDENYAREIMQLFSIGLYELNIDGSHKKDGQGNSIPTYSQKTIEAFAHIYTGWTYSGGDKFKYPSTKNYIDPMEAWKEVDNSSQLTIEPYHDLSAQVLLNGGTLPAGTLAEEGLKIALDNIFNHPNVGPFICRQLIQRLITSNPSPEYISRVAKIFNSNSNGIRGDLKEVVEAIILDPEARIKPDADSHFGKAREPLLRLTALWRAFKGTTNSGTNSYRYPLGDLIQGPMQSPTVFNFFSPDYSHPGDVRDNNLLSPELQIHDESSVTSMSNRLFSYTRYRVRGHNDQGADQNAIKDLVYINLDKEKELSKNPDLLIEHLNLILLSGEMSPFLKGIVKEMIEYTVIKDTDSESSVSSKTRYRATDAIIMIMNSPEFILQK